MEYRHRATLSRNDCTQTLCLPRECELPAEEVIIHRDGDRLIIEPAKRSKTLAELLAGWEPLKESDMSGQSAATTRA